MGQFPESASRSARWFSACLAPVTRVGSALLRAVVGRRGPRAPREGAAASVSTGKAGIGLRLAQLEARVAELERQSASEMQDYLQREAEAFKLVADLPEPPDYGTDDPWEIARIAGKGLTAADVDRLYREE